MPLFAPNGAVGMLPRVKRRRFGVAELVESRKGLSAPERAEDCSGCRHPTESTPFLRLNRDASSQNPPTRKMDSDCIVGNSPGPLDRHTRPRNPLGAFRHVRIHPTRHAVHRPHSLHLLSSTAPRLGIRPHQRRLELEMVHSIQLAEQLAPGDTLVGPRGDSDRRRRRLLVH